MSRLPGKKIDTWEWSKDRQVFKVDVRMASDSRNGGMHFGVVVRDLDIDIWHKDIDEVRRLVYAALNEKVHLTWEPHLYVRVSGDTAILKPEPKPADEDDYDDAVDDHDLSLQEIRERSQRARAVRFSLIVDVNSYELATTPTGQKLSRKVDEYRRRYDAREDWPDVGLKSEQDRFSYDSETEVEVQALVPDTRANREALNNLSRELQRLIDRLVGLCMPEVIQKTLASAIGTRLLTAGEPEPKGKKKR